MTFNQLPERLRNIHGLQLVTGETIKCTITESKFQVLESVFLPLLEQKDARKGAV